MLRFQVCEVCIARTGGAARMGLPQARRSLAAASRAGQAGPILIRFALLATIVFLILLGFVFFVVGVAGSVFEPVAAAGNCDYLGMMKEPVQDRRGRGDIAEQFSPILQRSVRGHYRWFCFVSPHDYFEQILTGTFGQLLDAHIIDY